MVLEPDYRVRGQHLVHQLPGMMQQLPQQQNWAPYPQQLQQRQGAIMQAVLVQPGAPFHGPYAIPVQGMPFQGPVMYPINAPAPGHLVGMQCPQSVWPGHAYMQHPLQQPQQVRMQPARRSRYSPAASQGDPARFPVQAGPGATPAPAQPMRAGVLIVPQLPAAAATAAVAARLNAAASCSTVSCTSSKSVATAMLVPQLGNPSNTRRGQGSAATALAGSTAAAALAAAAAAGGLKVVPTGSQESTDSGDAASTGFEVSSTCSSADWAESTAPQPAEDHVISGWAWLVDGILQQVVGYLQGNSSSLRAFRATCAHWRTCADASLQTLSPSALLPKDLVKRFPAVQSLQLVSCRNVRNRDLYVLAQSDLHLTSLVMGEDTNKPWVTNRGIESIAHMTPLRFIGLHDCNSVTNNGITALSSLTRLDRLSLRGCKKLTNNGMDVIKLLTGITQLNLYGCKRLSDSGIAPLLGLPLVALSLGQTRVRDEGLRKISTGLTRLTELHLVKEDVRPESLAHLSHLTGLEVLSLREMKVHNSIKAVLLSMTTLKELSLFRNIDVKDVLLDGLADLTSLTALDLRETCVKGTCFSDDNAMLMGLHSLKLKPLAATGAYNSANDQVLCEGTTNLPRVSVLTSLTSLSISLPAFPPALVEAVGRLKGLRDLDMSRACSGVAGEGQPLAAGVYVQLGRMTQLTALDLSRHLLEEAALHKALKRLPLLRRLTLGSTSLDGEAGAIRRLEKAHSAINVDCRKCMAESTPELASFGLAGTLSVL